MKTTRILALLAVALPLAFVSCSDDDDDDNRSSNDSGVVDESGTYNVGVTVLQGTDGNAYQLASILSSSEKILAYNYDSEGRCISAYEWGLVSNLEFNDDGSLKAITCINDDDFSYSISFNADGYVSKSSWYEADEGEGQTTTYYYTDGYLTKITGDYTDEWDYHESHTLTLTWKDGNLTKMVGSFSGKYDYDGDSSSGTDTYTYSYGNTSNDGRQYLIAIIDMICDYDDNAYLLGMPGFFGKGPVNLPTWCEDVYSYNESGHIHGDDWSCRLSYTKGSNGLISTENYDGDTYTYNYTSYGDGTRSAVTSPFEEIAPASTKAKVMGHHSRREKLKARHAAAKGTEE